MSGGTAGRRRVSSLRRAAGAVVVALAQTACASQGAPPGGPPDAAPPKLVRIIPDTGAVNVKAPRAVFQFDEVVSERPSGGAPSLEAMFVVSPRQGEPDVSWGRDVITVKPRRGFRPNTVYTITMLPGISDLRGNVRKEGATAVFSTGPTIPSTTVRGVVFDWVKSEPAARALVEAILVPPGADTSARARRDSTVYVTSSDSSGRFAFAHLPPGPYVVRGVLDANNNRALDPREAWDSVRVSLADSARVELLTFVHDTLGPRIASVSASDSVTLRVAFDNPLTPAVRPDSATYVLRAADSSVVPIMFVRAANDTSLAMVLPYTPPGARAPAAAGAKPPAAQPTPPPAAAVPAAPPPTRTPAPKPPATPRRPMTAAQRRAAAADSVRASRAADSVARADSIAAAAAAPAIPTTVRPARRDTTPAAPPRPRPSKSPPIQEVVIKLARPLAPGTTYRLEVRGARGILGATQSSDRTFTTPKSEAPADSTGRAPRPGGRPPARPAVPGARPDTSRAGPPTRPPA